MRRAARTRLAPTLSLLLACGMMLGACQQGPKGPTAGLDELRKSAATSHRDERVAEWLLAELLRPGGMPVQARKARVQLDAIEATGLPSSMARGLQDSGRGRSKQALEHFFDALRQAAEWDDQRAALFAWYAALRVQEIAPVDPGFGKRHRKSIQELLENPGRIGFRAYAVVVDLWAEDAFSEAEQNVDEKLARKVGCVSEVALAGPFGTGVQSDILRSFEAERPGVWPARFVKDDGQNRAPRRLETEVAGCDVITKDVTDPGVFYAQTFLTLTEPKDLILSASGAHQLFINDQLVQNRDVRVWGIWPKFGVAVRLPPGRHRVLWKTNQESTALRVVEPNGQPSALSASSDDGPGYNLLAPEVLSDPNELSRYVERGGVTEPRDELTRLVAAYLLDDEGESDAAAVLFEPLVKDPEQATGTALATAALFVQGDPIYDESQTRDLVHELELRAAERDPTLWYPRFSNLVWEATQRGATTVVKDLERLVSEFPEVARVHFTLAELYENLDWGPEYERTVLDLIQRFPNDPDAIKMAVDHFETEGDMAQVHELLERLLELDPDSELLVTRALNQKRYQDALAELRRLEARRPSRKDLAPRIERLLISAGDRQRTFEFLKKAIEEEPRDVHARLALADARLAHGDKNSLGAALIEAVEAGADPSPIASAIDLVEGATALEPYRIDGRKVIQEYEARAARCCSATSPRCGPGRACSTTGPCGSTAMARVGFWNTKS